MSIIRNTNDGRRAAESIMTSTVSVGALTETVDPVTFLPVVTVVPVWSGKGRIFTSAQDTQSVLAAGQVVAIKTLQLSVPVKGTHVITRDMIVEVTANHLDPSLVGSRYRITGASGESIQVARRYEIERYV